MTPNEPPPIAPFSKPNLTNPVPNPTSTSAVDKSPTPQKSTLDSTLKSPTLEAPIPKETTPSLVRWKMALDAKDAIRASPKSLYYLYGRRDIKGLEDTWYIFIL